MKTLASVLTLPPISSVCAVQSLPAQDQFLHDQQMFWSLYADTVGIANINVKGTDTRTGVCLWCCL